MVGLLCAGTELRRHEEAETESILLPKCAGSRSGSILRESSCGNNRVKRLAGLREIFGDAAHDRLGGHRPQSMFSQVGPQRFQNQLQKVVDGTAFDGGQLTVARSKLVVPDDPLSAPAKNRAQFDC